MAEHFYMVIPLWRKKALTRAHITSRGENHPNTMQAKKRLWQHTHLQHGIGMYMHVYASLPSFSDWVHYPHTHALMPHHAEKWQKRCRVNMSMPP
jgi:hypothetical protein